MVLCALAAGCSNPISAPPDSVLRCHVSTQNFEVSLVSSTGGASSPTSAAIAASRQPIPGMPGFRLPRTGWVVVHQSGVGASVRSDSYQVHATQGPDGTWRVDSGYRCLNPPTGGPPHPG